MYKDFTEMPMWQIALEIGELVFKITINLPKKEDYGLTSQIRRASVSISANIGPARRVEHPSNVSSTSNFAIVHSSSGPTPEISRVKANAHAENNDRDHGDDAEDRAGVEGTFGVCVASCVPP